MTASAENFDRFSFALRKQLAPKLRGLISSLGLRSVGDLAAMIAANDDVLLEVFRPMAKAHLHQREVSTTITEALAARPELQAEVMKIIGGDNGN